MNTVKEQLTKYDKNATYLKRFCCAPGEPYYAIGPINFLKAGIRELIEIIAENNFDTEVEKQRAFTLLIDYQNFYRLYKKSTQLNK